MNEVEERLCEFCGGTGWQIVMEGGVPRAKRCTCSRTMPGDKLLDSAKIPPRYLDCDFEHYDPQSFLQGKAKTMALNYAADYPHLDESFPEGGLLLFGFSGTGKTHLAVGVLKEILRKGISCLFVDFHDLLAEIRNSYDELSQTSELQILRPILTTEVLLLDDLGSQRMTEWMQDTVFHIINLRYQQKKALVATTNLGLEPTVRDSKETLRDRLGYRVVSRLYEMCTFMELDGPDYRKDIRKAGGDALRRRKEAGE